MPDTSKVNTNFYTRSPEKPEELLKDLSIEISDQTKARAHQTRDNPKFTASGYNTKQLSGEVGSQDFAPSIANQQFYIPKQSSESHHKKSKKYHLNQEYASILQSYEDKVSGHYPGVGGAGTQDSMSNS